MHNESSAHLRRLCATRYKPTPTRDSLFITTKVPAGFGNSTDCLPGQAGIDSAVNYVHENLRELGVTQVDLVLVHRPCQSKQTHDIKGSNQALWDGMLEVLKQNLTRAIGISNYEPADIEVWNFFVLSNVFPHAQLRNHNRIRRLWIFVELCLQSISSVGRFKVVTTNRLTTQVSTQTLTPTLQCRYFLFRICQLFFV